VIVPTTRTTTTANITAYSAMSCPRSSGHSCERKAVSDMFCTMMRKNRDHCHCFLDAGASGRQYSVFRIASPTQRERW